MEHAAPASGQDFNLVGALQIHGKGLAIWASLLLICGACAASPEPRPAQEKLPPFTPEEASLFDDSFSASVFSSDTAADIDDKLYLRTRRAEAVIPATVATVTEDRGSDGEQFYTLELRPTGPPLAGAVWTERVAVIVAPSSPSYGILRSLEASLVGTPVILFFRRYKDDGQVNVHWRAEPDRDDIRQAVQRGRVTGELR